jgi:hypothetical protein
MRVVAIGTVQRVHSRALVALRVCYIVVLPYRGCRRWLNDTVDARWRDRDCRWLADRVGLEGAHPTPGSGARDTEIAVGNRFEGGTDYLDSITLGKLACEHGWMAQKFGRTGTARESQIAVFWGAVREVARASLSLSVTIYRCNMVAVACWCVDARPTTLRWAQRLELRA